MSSMNEQATEQLKAEQIAESAAIAEKVETILEEVQELEKIAPAADVAPAPELKVVDQPGRGPVSTMQKIVTPRTVDDLTLSVEKIMEEDVGEAYQQLSPIAKQEFKLRGEQAAQSIRRLMDSAKLQVKKVFHLILHWLKMLPGINHFFLEQEAKIKTDRIVLLHQERKEKQYAA